MQSICRTRGHEQRQKLEENEWILGCQSSISIINSQVATKSGVIGYSMIFYDTLWYSICWPRRYILNKQVCGLFWYCLDLWRRSRRPKMPLLRPKCCMRGEICSRQMIRRCSVPLTRTWPNHGPSWTDQRCICIYIYKYICMSYYICMYCMYYNVYI